LVRLVCIVLSLSSVCMKDLFGLIIQALLVYFSALCNL